MTATCPNCGADLEGDVDTCPVCGHTDVPAFCDRHPDRNAVGRCVVCGSAVCDECDNDSVHHHICPAHADIEIIEGWAQLYSTATEVEADLIRDNLRSEGIDSEVLSQKDHTLRVDLGDLTPIRVLVPAFEYERAREIIAQHMDVHGELAFACPSCGEPYEAGQGTCANCGEALPQSAGSTS